MIASDIISRIQIATEQSSTDNDRFSQSDLLSIINEGYVDFCRFTEILEKVTTTVIQSLTSIVSLPSDFLEARQFKWSYNRTLYPIHDRILDWQEQGWPFRVSSTPENVIYTNYSNIRVKPIVSAAGTVTIKYAYIPTDLATSDEPLLLTTFHEALVDFGAAECFAMMHDWQNMERHQTKYEERREKARTMVKQKSPDIMVSQRPINVFNYPLFDARFRSRR